MIIISLTNTPKGLKTTTLFKARIQNIILFFGISKFDEFVKNPIFECYHLFNIKEACNGSE